MRQINDLIRRRQFLYQAYREALAGCSYIALPPADGQREWACIRFPVRVMGNKYDYYRKAAGLGIDFAFSFTFVPCPPHCRRALALAQAVLDLPFYHKLKPEEFNRTVGVLRRLEGRFSSTGSSPELANGPAGKQWGASTKNL
jgi:dTDP-4-amino-4,6-dideoxygalactose transaminase